VAATATRGRGVVAGGTGQQVGPKCPDDQQPGTREHPHPHPRTIRLLGDTLGLPSEACDELIAACRAVSRGGLIASFGGPVPSAGTGGSVVPRELPGLVRHFVGREGELAALNALADQAADRAPGPVVISTISGTAGVGGRHWRSSGRIRRPGGFRTGNCT